MATKEQRTDEELVEIVRTHDKQVYADLVKRYQDKLFRYAVTLVHDEDKALDAVQESFISAYMNLNGFDTGKKFSSWIYRIVHNQAMNGIRKYGKEQPLLDNDDIPGDQDVEQAFSRQEVVENAHSCLRLLPVVYREPLALFYLDEKSYIEISDILRIPMGTVATRINRAKGMMKRLCRKNT